MTATLPSVDATPSHIDESRHEPATGTLGALLYADNEKALVTEEAWVELVRSAAAGDQHGLHALYERTHRIVFTLIMRLTNNRETAEEVTLDVYHDVWRRAAAYDPAAGTVVGWIMNQARSRAIDRLRFDQRKKRVNPRAEDPLPQAAAVDPLDDCALRERDRQLRTALTVLTRDERQAIESAFFADLTYAEVAERLNQPLGTIKTRVRSGLQKLRQSLGGNAP